MWVDFGFEYLAHWGQLLVAMGAFGVMGMVRPVEDTDEQAAEREAEAELLKAVKAGDPTAYQGLVEKYQNRVYHLVYGMVRNREDASDITQDAFVKAYRKIDSFRLESSFYTWLYRIAINHCKNRRMYQRRRHTQQHDSLDKPLGDEEDGKRRELPSDGPLPDSGIHRTEAQQILQKALEQLDEEQRFIIVLRDMEDRSYEEIAELLNLPRGTVKSRLHRARQQLARHLSRTLTIEDVVSG